MTKTFPTSFRLTALLRGLKTSTLEAFFARFPALQADFSWFSLRQRSIIIKLLKAGLSGSLFDGWENRSREARLRILSELSSLDLDRLSQNALSHRRFIESNGRDISSNLVASLAPPRWDKICDLTALDIGRRVMLEERGLAYKQAGKLGVLVLAGGFAQRLGKGPKALISFDGKRSFIQALAEDVRKAGSFSSRVPLFIMTGPGNDADIKQHVRSHNNFGLDTERLIFFRQEEVCPKLDVEGGLAIAPDGSGIDFYPIGHGYVIKGIQQQLMDTCRRLGLQTLFIRNIDNLGASVGDPSFDAVLGHHLISGAGLTVELVRPKITLNPLTGEDILQDRGGAVFSRNGQNIIVEYFAAPPPMMATAMRNPFNTANLAINIEAAAKIDTDRMRWYIVRKEVNMAGKNQVRYQFEKMIGDATHQLASNFVIVEREGARGRFLPVKTPSDLEYAAKVFPNIDKLKA